MSLVSNNKIEANKYQVEISADAEAFEKAIQAAYMKAKKNINVNGFRKGKAPRKMIEKLYGENCFFEDAVNELVPVVVAPEVEALKLDLIDTPNMEVTSVSKTEGVMFKLILTVKPEVEISSYKGLEVTKTVKDVTDEDVNAEIEKLRDRNGRMVTVEDRAAANGDIAVIDFEGFLDGVPFDGGKEDKFELNLGAGQFVPGFEEQIVGKNAGEDFTIAVTFPEDYQMEELAGKPTEFKIKLHEIRTKELPALDDEFAKDATDFDTLDEVKADLKTKLEERAKHEANMAVDNALIEAVVENTTVEIPEVMVNHKIDDMVRDFEMRLSQQGLNMQMYLEFAGTNIDDFRATFKDRATKEVKVRLALEGIVKLENIEIADDDAKAELQKMADMYKMTIAQITNYISLDNIKLDMAVAKAVDVIKENAKIAE